MCDDLITSWTNWWMCDKFMSIKVEWEKLITGWWNKLRSELTGQVWPRLKVYNPCPTYLCWELKLHDFFIFPDWTVELGISTKNISTEFVSFTQKVKKYKLMQDDSVQGPDKNCHFFQFCLRHKIWGVFQWFSNLCPWSYKNFFIT